MPFSIVVLFTDKDIYSLQMSTVNKLKVNKQKGANTSNMEALNKCFAE